MIDLSGRVALVTGASRGIGRAAAIALARAGADVAINYRAQGAEAETTRDRVEALGRRAVCVQADVTDEAQVAHLVEQAVARLGPVGILVNNAGGGRHQEIDEISPEDWDAIQNTNLRSAFLVTRAVLPAMREAGWGRIVMVTSGAASTGGIVGLHYTAAKAGMEGLTRAYAKRLVTQGITVNNVAPALIHTDMTRDLEARQSMIPMGRLGTAEEVGDAIVFAAGCAYMTGQTLHLNGGLYFR